MAERETIGAETLNSDKVKLKELYEFRLAEGMYVIPAFNEPHHFIVTASDREEEGILYVLHQ